MAAEIESMADAALWMLGRMVEHKTGGPTMVVRSTRVQDVPQTTLWCLCAWWIEDADSYELEPQTVELAAHELFVVRYDDEELQ